MSLSVNQAVNIKMLRDEKGSDTTNTNAEHSRVIAANLTYLNFVAGAVIMFIIFVPIQTTIYKRDRLQHNGIARPEARFLLSLFTVWGFPISLLWFAFTSSGNVSYWSPVIAGAVLGVADPLLWLSILNYITDSYPNVAGSAIAAFLIPSQLLAAGCVHIGTCVFFLLLFFECTRTSILSGPLFCLCPGPRLFGHGQKRHI